MWFLFLMARGYIPIAIVCRINTLPISDRGGGTLSFSFTPFKHTTYNAMLTWHICYEHVQLSPSVLGVLAWTPFGGPKVGETVGAPAPLPGPPAPLPAPGDTAEVPPWSHGWSYTGMKCPFFAFSCASLYAGTFSGSGLGRWPSRGHHRGQRSCSWTCPWRPRQR